jgi:exodeoxyribonuclease V alpha subunit
MPDSVTGSVERITYFNSENGYTVLRLRPDKKSDPDVQDAVSREGTLTVIGVMPELGIGESVEYTGAWINDPKYGKQFRAETVTPTQPDSLDGIRRYLSSGIVKGIGEATADKIVKHFGRDTLTILNGSPQRLHEVRGLKESMIPKLIKAWEENVGTRQTMIFLQQYGVSPKMAKRIIDHYGSTATEAVKANPYTLADDVFGIGFMRADQVALKMGFARDSMERMRAGLNYALNSMASDGHTCAPRGMLIETGLKLLQIDEGLRDKLESALDMQLMRGDLIADNLDIQGHEDLEVIYLPDFHKAERDSAKALRLMANTPSSLQSIYDEKARPGGLPKNTRQKDAEDAFWTEFVSELAEETGIRLSDQQQDAVRAALDHKISVMTGGPGTGKTTTLKMVVAALNLHKRKFSLASPTGRAAKRLGEATGEYASTVHRLLGYTADDGFSMGGDSQLDVEMVIVDESSMLDLKLLTALLRAMKPETHLMFVGDVDQLPSVGAGNVLRDVIACGLAHVTVLDAIFRQEAGSHIVTNAHSINHGELPQMDNQSDDFFFFRADTPEEAGELTLEIVTERLGRKFGDINPLSDVQVIAPMYRGPAGVDTLNRILQQALNPPARSKPEKKHADRIFRFGDKVMQIKNNYDKDVFNGDIGIISGVDIDDNVVEVSFDGLYASYEFDEFDQLVHAYCISVHKSQGAEYPIVVLPLMTQHYVMLQRNLLYTAVTRAKRAVVLVGMRQAVSTAVKNKRVSERFSGLLPRLQASNRRG